MSDDTSVLRPTALGSTGVPQSPAQPAADGGSGEPGRLAAYVPAYAARRLRGVPIEDQGALSSAEAPNCDERTITSFGGD